MDQKDRIFIGPIKSKFFHASWDYGILQLFFAGVRRINWQFSTLWYRHAFGHLGKDSIVKNHISVMFPKRIFIGDQCHIGVGCIFTSENYEGRLTIDDNVSLVEACRIDFSGGVLIEQGAHLSPRCQIITHDHKYDPYTKPSFHFLRIGRRSWIGNNSLILFNVSEIGEYAIVGAGSVVTKDVPDKAIVIGNPAKVIKYRDDVVEP
jgi:acetyltransferase-like isoleucine patch superfamily enzyme